jgi:hypothetical protein
MVAVMAVVAVSRRNVRQDVKEDIAKQATDRKRREQPQQLMPAAHPPRKCTVSFRSMRNRG